MRVLIAPQEFKGSLTALEAVAAMEMGLRRALPDARIDRLALADGGPGTVRALVLAAGGRYSLAVVEGPLGEPVAARWGRIQNGRTAVIEMAAAAGLHLIPANRLDPRRASTYGVGELIQAALDSGVEQIWVGVGGSATNDGGAGMAAALGARLLDDADRPLPAGAAALVHLARIDLAALDPRLHRVEAVALVDVQNPLCGPAGASRVYGPQKGADPLAVEELERALVNYADIVTRDLGIDVAAIPGGGAGGGLAAGLVAFAGARIAPGVETIAQALHLRDHVTAADLVITGEGRLDRQSTFGKTVAGVARVAADMGVPCLAVAGSVADPDAVATIPGLIAVEAATPPDLPLAQALARAAEFVATATERLLRRVFPQILAPPAPGRD